ncbi:MAG: quinoprotein dehydrogenase-associated SoxYZ-like carrier [Paracoccaceae bacterium]
MLVRTGLAAIAVLCLAGTAIAGGASARPSETWEFIREATFPDATIADAEGMIEIDAPVRAQDAAIVPVSLRVRPTEGRRVERLTLIVEENPAPIAAEFAFGERMGRDVALSTRLRVNAYSNVRVVAELDDGALIEAARFVKASGGCAAPATKDPDAAAARLGRMKLRRFADAGPAAGMDEAQVMVRHPNNSGFQVDQVSLLTIPAFFVDRMEVSLDGERLFAMTGGISLSEDPSFRFAYPAVDDGTFEVVAGDNEGGVYRDSFPVGQGS